ncbi:MAG: magnesium/cobalt transporter CorA [Candidatus Eisenbacteria bacterium]
MARHFRRSHKKIASAPGTVEFAGEKKVEHVRISVMDYDKEHFDEKANVSVDECLPYFDKPEVTWINVNGLHDTAVLQTLGDKAGLHPLVLEDIINTHQRPKIEEFPGYLYIVMRMLRFDEEKNHVSGEQISIILGPNYVLSFQEVEGDMFDPVRERIRIGRGRSRKLKSDYLAYALVDAVVDHYFAVLEKMGDRIESLEERVTEDPTTEVLHAIHGMKRELIFVRKSVFPVRELISSLSRTENPLIQKGTDIFLRDAHDHTIQVIDALESYRDILSGLQDLYLSGISNRMNEVMKVLTIAATIFVPLTFFAGIYGMNFDFIPELHYKWAYPAFWGVMLVMGGGMVVFFKRRGWL